MTHEYDMVPETDELALAIGLLAIVILGAIIVLTY